MLFDKILRASITFRIPTDNETETFALNNRISALSSVENKLITTKLNAHNTHYVH